MGTWTIGDIPWGRFRSDRVDGEILKLVKAASVVEHNGRDYARYLTEVFHDDPAFHDIARQWAEEEVQHGQALARWATLADPGFDFDAAFRDFTARIKLPAKIERSVRGSRVGELVARCMVEVGTSSYYSALMAGTDEPVLKEICRRIAADEFRHYKMFYDHMKLYLERDRIGFWTRLRIALARIVETEDDELAFAYYAANHRSEGPYDRGRYIAAYMARAYRFYQPAQIRLSIAMILKAVGLKLGDRLLSHAAYLVYLFIRSRGARLARAGAMG